VVEAIASDIPQVELDWLLQELAGLDKLALRLESFKDLPKIELKLSVSELDRLWQRRLLERVPVQYLTGVAHWRDFSLKVTPAVLIPRPETELLIDLAVDAVKSYSVNRKSDWVDLGTGSGAIAIGLASELTNATVYAVDCCSEALAVARQNAEFLSRFVVGTPRISQR
jgi:release factor glutamine methyltransferase